MYGITITPKNKLFNMYNRHNRFILILILVLVNIISISQSYSQNYKLVNKDRQTTFARLNSVGMDSLYYFMQIDSFSLEGTDTIFYFNQQLRTPPVVDPFCSYVFNDSVLLGNRVLVKSDTDITHVFFNNQNDSIFIHSQINLGDTWKVYKWSNGSYVKATVVNKLEQELVGGILDSFYRIKLNVFTLAGAMLTDTFPNDTKIDISEDIGIVEFFNFNLFPQPGDSIARVLRGVTTLNAGVVDVNAKNAFNYNLGNEFHYREEVVPDNNSDADKRISAWKYFVLNKTETVSNVTYTMERIQFDTLYFGASTTLNITWDTTSVTLIYDDYGFLDTLELMVFHNDNFGFSDWMKIDTIYAGIPHKYVYDWYNYDADTKCLNNPENISMPEQLYGNGLGLMHYLDSTDTDNYYKYDLSYFKLGLNEWGIPYDFSSLDNSINSNSVAETINVYPNPCVNYFYINLSDNFINSILEIYDISGKLVKVETLMNNLVNISELESGIYTLKLKSNSLSMTGKFIKI